jgi:hypothetical protein
MNIGAYQKFTARISLACEYGRRESKDQLLERLRDALRQLAAEQSVEPTVSKRGKIARNGSRKSKVGLPA